MGGQAGMSAITWELRPCHKGCVHRVVEGGGGRKKRGKGGVIYA